VVEHVKAACWATFASPLCPVTAVFDEATGMLAGMTLRNGDDEQAVPVRMAAEVEVGGVERRGPTGGLVYTQTDILRGSRLAGLGAKTVRDADSVTQSIRTEHQGWHIQWHWTIRREPPWLSLALVVEPPEANSRPLRNLTLTLDSDVPPGGGWKVHSPGNPIRPGVPVDGIPHPVGVSPAGGVRGSSGLIVLTRERRPLTLALWPFSWTEIGSIDIRSTSQGLRTNVRTDLAGDPPDGTGLAYSGLYLHLEAASWSELRPRIPQWYAAVGLATPRVKPDWVQAASAYEVQVGYSVFANGFRYAPYPQMADLLDDLDRIQDLGFDTLQIMPRQPYPSYNVHGYDDVTTTYGDEATLRTLVERCHGRGMRVILDVLLHGVVDRRSVRAAADMVRSGPYRDRLLEDTGDLFSSGLEGQDISWSRHILDFEPYWCEGSPEEHPLVSEHPDWFCRDSNGNVIGIYTEAFDLANPEWQAYFCNSMMMLVERLGVDGFRFDAPTYNHFPNWSVEARERASASMLGCVSLFRRLRPLLKALDQSLMMYTEPSGVVLRESMDLNYNYDEQWLITAVLRPREDESAWTVRDAGEMALWLAERDAVLPCGSLTAHHIDSHDTFWWPLPGGKWRREQFGIDATRALMSAFALCGGAFMMFVGGEQDIEGDLRRTLSLRQSRPELRDGEADYGAVRVSAADVFAVVRRWRDRATLVVVNLSANAIRTECTLARENFPLAPVDLYRGQTLKPAADPSVLRVDLAAYEVMLVALAPTADHSH